MIEALAGGAGGVPVSAFPVAGPPDVICGRNGAPIGTLGKDLAKAIRGALRASGSACLAEARLYSRDACTDQFPANLARPRSARAAGRLTTGH